MLGQWVNVNVEVAMRTGICWLVVFGVVVLGVLGCKPQAPTKGSSGSSSTPAAVDGNTTRR
jgi:quinol-cytochrome oxidoreductase complex cytochrome b subunit